MKNKRKRMIPIDIGELSYDQLNILKYNIMDVSESIAKASIKVYDASFRGCLKDWLADLSCLSINVILEMSKRELEKEKETEDDK